MTVTFESLGISEARVTHLEKKGFVEPTEIQKEAIPKLLAGEDVGGQAQTGTGKTAAFSLPILEQIDIENREVQALILTPTRELAMQVCNAMRDLNGDRRLRVFAVYGGSSIERQIQRLERGVQIVVGTPGRVLDLLNRDKLNLDSLTHLVLDEADEMLSMGFIDDVEKILAKAPTERQTAFFSATMDASIRKLMQKFMRDPVTVKIEQRKAAPKQIEQRVYMVPRGWSKSRSLLPILELEEPEAAIVFVRTRRSAAELTSQLQGAGHSVDEYHGDLNQSQRERLISRFRKQQVRWIVATDIAARGLDVDHLTHVINYDLPDHVESYVHRIGRTGRAGREGIAISLIQPFDRRKLQQIERHMRQNLKISSIPTRAQIEARHLEKLQTQVREALSGERLASFLPIVAQLSEEYDPHTIAAAALQMAYDGTRPNWANEYDEDPPQEYYDRKGPRRNSRRSSRPTPKPIKRSKKSKVSSREAIGDRQ
ncbi:DEAD/DEAH box helicase [Phormidium sp. CCY1219]|uniref:DEAD/DEAH box helicase n=1 Tax=Phormidium sp. CCY1219 TaxID=2886104 RepID=UPI002D1F2884|nr:DEAD/DEAH box helicase [Phormidium sp. CCY1219]MEB3829506.1 DEAD/DEAH box helicase [Phormidium sp. CCY1219]